MTKKQQAQQLFDDIVRRSGAQTIDSTIRGQIIKTFIEKLNMTPAGAATYYAVCKSLSSFGNAQPSIARPQLRTTRDDDRSPQIDAKQMYTVCKIVDNCVESTDSYFDPSLIKLGKHDVVVRGLPPIGQSVSSLKTINL